MPRRWNNWGVSELPEALRRELQKGGYYPELVARVLSHSLGGQEVIAYLVHPDTSFDSAVIYRHLTAAVLTPTRLIGVHVDDDPSTGRPHALATTEAVALRRIQSVVLSYGVADPAGAATVDELTMGVHWGTASRIDLEPMGCPDPDCEADHGYAGVLTADDLVLRVSAAADGAGRLAQAIEFASALSAAVARSESV